MRRDAGVDRAEGERPSGARRDHVPGVVGAGVCATCWGRAHAGAGLTFAAGVALVVAGVTCALLGPVDPFAARVLGALASILGAALVAVGLGEVRR